MVLLSVIGLLLAWRYLPYLDRANAALRTARAIESQASTLRIEDVDAAFVERMRSQVSALRTDIEPLRSLLETDPLVGLVRGLPATGEQLRAADHVTEAARHLLDAADVALSLADRFAALRTASPDAVLPGIVGLIATSRPDVERIRTALVAADRSLTAAGPAPDGKIGEAAAVMGSAIGRYGPLLDLYASIDGLVPGLLGWGGEQRYLVLAVDPAELRPGGGYTGTVGVVSFTDGRLGAHDFVDVYSLDFRRGVPFQEPPEGLQNHLLGEASWQLADANWSPDWPTSAQDARRLYTLESGDTQVDGVIAVTTYAIDRILEVTGPIDVPEYGVTVHPGEVTLTALAQTRDISPGTDRKAFLNDVAAILLARLQALPPSKWVDLFRALEDVASRRLIMAWTDDPVAQSLLATQPIGGAVRQDAGDYLYVVEANVAPTSKYNLVVQRSTDLDVTLLADGSATERLRLRWQNDSLKEGEPYASLREWSTSKSGIYGAYVRVLVSQDSELVNVGGDSGGPITSAEDVLLESGRTAITNYLLMPAGQSELTYGWDAHGVAQPSGTDWLYRLTIQKQAGTLPEPLTVRVTLPEGAVPISMPEDAINEAGTLVLSTNLATDVQVDVRYALP